MKYAIPEISWHNRDPVLSVDFQPKRLANEPLRLATGGTDSHVLIWHITSTESGSVNLEVAADLTRHQKAVNVVRWSPSGQYLASGDDESIIFLWKQNMDKELATPLNPIDEDYKETWVIFKTLRGHMEDVLDVSWSPDSLFLSSGSVDNKLIIWDVSRGKYTSILSDHKGFVQGVAWDPKNRLIATASSDRVFRTFDIATKKVVSRSSKAVLPVPEGHSLHGLPVRLYHDDTLQSFYRRVSWSPDGMLAAVPAGRVEAEGKTDTRPINAAYIYTRHSLKVPACVIPTNTPALVVRWSPIVYAPRTQGPPPAVPLPRRMILAIATRAELVIYDTSQKTPIGLISNIHYTRLTDLSWSPDGETLVASSTDGFCSIITFSPGELGEPLPLDDTEPMEVDATPQDVKIETIQKTEEPKPSKLTPKSKKDDQKPMKTIDSFIQFKPPGEDNKKTTKGTKPTKTPVKFDVLEEVAMPSWNDNSNTEIIKPRQPEPTAVIEIEDSEDIKLVYEETVADQSAESETITPDAETIDNESPIRKSPSKRIADSEVKTPDAKTDRISNESADFLKQAKVTDVSEAVAQVMPSPKAPRRVSFVTLSSPKNSKKK